MSFIDRLHQAGKTTAMHGLFGANDEVFGVAKNMWYKNPNKAMVWSVAASAIALSTIYNKNIAIAAAILDPFVARACTAHKIKVANEIPPELKRKRMIGTMITATSAIAAGSIILESIVKPNKKHIKKPCYTKTTPQHKDGKNV